MLAVGLTDVDVRRLDVFEGEEYVRRGVRVRRLEGKEEGKREVEVEVETYVWVAGRDRLEEQEWDFETFEREKMRFWIDEEGGRDEFDAVDRVVDGTGGRGLGGGIGRQLELDRKGEEALGSAV